MNDPIAVSTLPTVVVEGKSGTTSPDSRARVPLAALITGSVVVFIGTFLLRFLTPDFVNDHFQHLARGRQILLGELPIRDFFDPGLIFQYYASALALAWSGQNLYGEALLTISFIAAGTALTFAAAAVLSGSLRAATAAALVLIISSPRLYNYPKVFFYVAALVVAWHYASRPGWRRIAAMALVTVLAFLFRHDHGVYIALATLALIPILHWRHWRRLAGDLACYAAIGLLLIAPFLLFVEQSVGLIHYVRGISPQIEHVSTFRLNALRFELQSITPLAIVLPPPEQRVTVRWIDTISVATRQARERTRHLISPVWVEGATWNYAITDASHANIRALVNDPLVIDTNGINRGAGTLALHEPLYMRLARRVPLLRLRVLPGLFTPSNALSWFYYATLLIPLAALGLLARRLWRGTIERREAAVTGMAILLCAVIIQTLVRGSPDSRLADVAAPVFTLAAWLTIGTRPARPSWRRVWSAAVTMLWGLTLWSASTDGYFWPRLEASRILTGPEGISENWREQSRRLHVRPIDNWAVTDGGIPSLGRYVFDCTLETDRILVTWFAPEIFFYAERAFAGGQVYLQPRWHASTEDQQLTVARMTHERVPLVLVSRDRDYGIYFPIVYDYVKAHYREAITASDKLRDYRVFVDTRLMPSRTYEPFGLPCYRP